METELIKEKFHNLEKWKDKVDPIIWQSKSNTERVMETLEKIEEARHEEKKSRRQINILLIMAILSPIAAILVTKIFGGI